MSSTPDRFELPVDETSGDGSALFDSTHHLPPRLVIDSADLLRDFKAAIGTELHPRDIDMMVAQVVQGLLMKEENGDLEATDLLVDFNGMRSTDLVKSENLREKAQQAMYNLSFRLFERLQNLQAYHRGEFPYFLDQILPGGDLLLSKLPH